MIYFPNLTLLFLPLFSLLHISSGTFPSHTSGNSTLAIYMLSRGQGVPDRTVKAFDSIQSLLNDAHRRGAVLSSNTTTIGIEGERRICVVFASDEDARTIAARIIKMIAGVELINLSQEKC